MTVSTSTINANKLENPNSDYVLLYESKCPKLKQDSNSHIYYQIAQHKTSKVFAVSITGNDNAGLHSKEWISFNEIHTLLSELVGAFGSSAFTPLFKSKSRNNAGFLVAILKSPEIGLLQTAVGYHFQYCKVEKYAEQIALLNKRWESLAKEKSTN